MFSGIGCMHRKPIFELLPFDPEIERNLRNLKKSKVEQLIMEDNQSGRYSEGHSDQNELLGI